MANRTTSRRSSKRSNARARKASANCSKRK